MKPPYIENGWKTYREQVVPARAKSFQVAETRQAFFTGASTTWKTLLLLMRPGLEAEPEDVKLWTDVNEELNAFAEAMRAEQPVSDEGIIAAAWRGYRDTCLPDRLNPDREDDTRMAFYGGATVLIRSLAVLTNDVTEQEATKSFDAIEKEVDEFGAQLDTTFGFGVN